MNKEKNLGERVENFGKGMGTSMAKIYFGWLAMGIWPVGTIVGAYVIYKGVEQFKQVAGV